MLVPRSSWRRPAALLRQVAAPTLLALSAGGALANPPAIVPTAAGPGRVAAVLPDAPAAAPALDLPACRALALQNQPALAAARASLAAAVSRAQALDNLRVPTFLVRDLPTRRKQANLGVAAAQAGVQQAEVDTVYGVHFGYLTVLYANQQKEFTDDALLSLKDLYDSVKAGINEGKRKDLRAEDLNRLAAYTRVAEARREEALQGTQRAYSALREALGVCPDYPLTLANKRLLKLEPAVDLALVLDAVARRPELAQAATAAQVTHLEVCAQGSQRFKVRVPTFATGSDIHSHPLPAGSYDERYRPAAVGPEMPGTLNGPRADRVETARIYAGRADAVVAKARGLLTLEAEQAYLKYVEASAKAAKYDLAAKDAEAAARAVRKRFTPVDEKMAVSLDQVVNAAFLQSQMRVLANEARYQQLLALAQLERVTACGFVAGFDTAPEVPENNGNNNNGNGNGPGK